MEFGVIWDWDGVVIDSSRQHERSWKMLADELGHPFTHEDFARGFGQINHRMLTTILGWTQDPNEIRALGDRKEALYRELLRNDPLELLPGVQSLLDALRAEGIGCVVGSSTPRKNLEVAIEALGLDGYFSALTASEDVDRGKPDPEVFLKAAQKLGLPPARCIVIEDTAHGLEAGLKGGMKTLGVATTHPENALHAAGAHAVTHRLDTITVNDLRQIFALSSTNGEAPE